MNGIVYCLMSVVLCLLMSCAKQVAPAGGPKDELPPKVLHTKPENFSTNFNSKTVTIAFDEFVELKDVQTQVFMSPSANKKPEVKLRNKIISIDLPDSLQENTTYTIYFGNAIRDVNESNVLKNFQYVFSTGAYIDSLRLQGFVINSLNNKPYQNALVMLHRDVDDSVIVKQNPDYFIRTDDQGYYRMDHLRGGDYKLTALDDANNNFRYENSEAIAFRDSLVNVKDTMQAITLYVFKSEAGQNRVTNSRTAGVGRIQATFSKPVENLKASLVSPVETPLDYTYNYYRDTLIFYPPQVPSDTMLLRLQQVGMDTTLKLRVVGLSGRDTLRRKGIATPTEPTINLINTLKATILPFGQKLRIYFPSPIAHLDSTKLNLVTKDDSTKSLPINVSLQIDSFYHRHYLQIDFTPTAQTEYILLLEDSMSHDALRKYSKVKRYEFRYGTPDESGNLIVHVKNMDSSLQYLLVLRSTQFGFEKKWFISGKETDVKANDLVAGSYSLQLIRDDNRNGKRDTGNYWQHRQPETAINYGSDLTIRANWDLEITMTASGGKSGDKKSMGK